KTKNKKQKTKNKKQKTKNKKQKTKNKKQKTKNKKQKTKNKKQKTKNKKQNNKKIKLMSLTTLTAWPPLENAKELMVGKVLDEPCHHELLDILRRAVKLCERRVVRSEPCCSEKLGKEITNLCPANLLLLQPHRLLHQQGSKGVPEHS